jgi:putative FmdB family regulatory protein
VPLYEYKCKKCGHRFERIQTYSAADPTECPVCQGEVERMISAPNAHFKGSGFYSTDYGAKPPASSGKSDGNSSSDNSSATSDKGASDKGSSTKSDTPSTPAPSTSAAKSE